MGGRISESTIREVRDRADIIEVISETVPLSRAGASFRGLCPFHREKTPSFFVNPARQAFKCFGCGEGGSVIDFLMKARNLSFADAVEELAGRCGVEVRYEGGRPHQSAREDLYGIVRLACETYRELLSSPSGKAGPPGGKPRAFWSPHLPAGGTGRVSAGASFSRSPTPAVGSAGSGAGRSTTPVPST